MNYDGREYAETSLRALSTTAPSYTNLVYRPATESAASTTAFSTMSTAPSQSVVPSTGLGQQHALDATSTIANAENKRLVEIIAHMGPGHLSADNIDYYAYHGRWPRREPSDIEITVQFSMLIGNTTHYSNYVRTVSADKLSDLRAFQDFAKAERKRAYQFANLFQPTEALNTRNLLIELHYDHGRHKEEFIAIAGARTISRWYEEQVIHGACHVLRARIAYLDDELN